MQIQFTIQTTQPQTIARDDNGKFAPTLASMKAWEKACKADAAKERRRQQLALETGDPLAWSYLA